MGKKASQKKPTEQVVRVAVEEQIVTKAPIVNKVIDEAVVDTVIGMQSIVLIT
jgi:hypothetical protein